MYLVKSNDGNVIFESIVEPTVEEVELTPDTEIRDRPWYFEPSVSIATNAKDNLPKDIAEYAQLRTYNY